MCNWYMMYWTLDGQDLSNKVCMSNGPPYYYWQQDGFRNIPEADVSSLPGKPHLLRTTTGLV